MTYKTDFNKNTIWLSLSIAYHSAYYKQYGAEGKYCP